MFTMTATVNPSTRDLTAGNQGGDTRLRGHPGQLVYKTLLCIEGNGSIEVSALCYTNVYHGLCLVKVKLTSWALEILQ